jgi:steroid delta-isomerase-like uncharacterized protein
MGSPAPPHHQQEDIVSTEQNRKIVARLREEFWNAGRMEIARELCGPNFASHDPGRPDVHTLEQLIAYASEVRHAFPDFHVSSLDEVAEGDTVAVRWEVTGTHQAEIMGIPATRKAVTTPGMTFYRFSGGRIVEMWWNVDHLGTMRQVGAIPEMAHG